MKVMEIVNVVIDESSNSGSEKFSEEFPKEILPLESKEVQELLNKSLHLQVLPRLQVLWKIPQIYSFHHILNLMKRKDFLPGLN